MDYACDLWWISDEEIKFEIVGPISELGIELLNVDKNLLVNSKFINTDLL